MKRSWLRDFGQASGRHASGRVQYLLSALQRFLPVLIAPAAGRQRGSRQSMVLQGSFAPAASGTGAVSAERISINVNTHASAATTAPRRLAAANPSAKAARPASCKRDR